MSTNESTPERQRQQPQRPQQPQHSVDKRQCQRQQQSAEKGQRQQSQRSPEKRQREQAKQSPVKRQRQQMQQITADDKSKGGGAIRNEPMATQLPRCDPNRIKRLAKIATRLSIDKNILCRLLETLDMDLGYECGMVTRHKSSHGGEVLPKMCAFMLKHRSLFDVQAGGEDVFVDGGCGGGIFFSFAVSMRPSWALSIGVDIERSRTEATKRRLRLTGTDARGWRVLKRNLVPGPDCEVDEYVSAIESTIPTRFFFNNYGGCFLDHHTDKIHLSAQAKFENEVNHRNLFADGSMIISFHCMGLDEHRWRADAYIVDLPLDCLSWKSSIAKGFYIYKYTKVRNDCAVGQEVCRKSWRKKPQRLQFVDYLKGT